MSSRDDAIVSLPFRLDVEDDWPPVAVESLQLRHLHAGYEVQSAPLFLKDLSVGDVIDVTLGDKGLVESWSHKSRSTRTTIWILRLKSPNGIDAALAKLRLLGCHTVRLESVGCYAVDVAGSIPISSVDKILESLDSNSVAIAFPSMRHPD
ncbi:MAG: DUF4265 domain-containing protein [Rubrivivax sp.]